MALVFFSQCDSKYGYRITGHKFTTTKNGVPVKTFNNFIIQYADSIENLTDSTVYVLNSNGTGIIVYSPVIEILDTTGVKR